MLARSALRLSIEAEARRLGFPLVGIATPEPPQNFQAFEAWLEAGRHAEMGYLAVERSRRRRADPRRILPECRSILSLGIPYPASLEVVHHGAESPEPGIYGRVAAYAWGDDYHDVLAGRLRALAGFIESQAGEPVLNRCYTDSGPILERDLAQRAGLGWVGKNTCLIHPQLGSYLLLAEILLGIELEPDLPFLPDRCGKCRRCIEACPTGCILPDRTIDARRCISYLTIELKRVIPVELRLLIGFWVFGCDVCQQVCPWNRDLFRPGRVEEPARPGMDFSPRPGVPSPNLVEELSLTPGQFNHKFKGSPVQRARRRGYLRNVAVALGNAGGPQAAPALLATLQNEPEPLVRGHAAWALGRIGGGIARFGLEKARQSEVDEFVLGEIITALNLSYPAVI